MASNESDEYVEDVKAFEEELKTIFASGGLHGLKKYLEKKLHAWKDVTLRIGVTGQSGVGKSSFINTIRGLRAGNENAAATGATETTVHVTEYRHPTNSQLVFCDLPGVGTPRFTKDTYLTDKSIGFDKFDMFIILSGNRITENDIWLAKEIKKRRKAYVFIRSQIDLDISKEKNTKPEKYEASPDAEKELEDAIRSNLETELKKAGVFKQHRVFLINCTDITWKTYDFKLLIKYLLNDTPALKREALTMSLSAKTEDMIREKVKFFKRRAFYLSFLSAAFGTVPVPGVSATIDAYVIAVYMNKCRTQLGVTTEDLAEIARKAGVTDSSICEGLSLKIMKVELSILGISKVWVCEKGVEKISELIPVLGSYISSTSAFISTIGLMNMNLDDLESDSLKLLKYMQSHSISV